MNSEPTSQEVRNVLLQALALMNEKGQHWVRGHYRQTIRHRNKEGEWEKEVSFCSVGAVRELTVGKRRLRRAVLKALAGSLSSNYRYGTIEGRITSWNDSPSRRWADIEKGFTEAVKTVESKK